MVTPAQRAFVLRLWGVSANTVLSPAARELMIAHAAFESGWGTNRPSRLGHNHWNLTRIKSDRRPVIESGDLEYDDAGHVRPIRQRFRAYPSDEAAVEDYLFFLSHLPRYHYAWTFLKLGNCAEFVRALREDDPTTAQIEGGYFTAPLAEYQQGMAGTLAVVRAVLKEPATPVA